MAFIHGNPFSAIGQAVKGFKNLNQQLNGDFTNLTNAIGSSVNDVTGVTANNAFNAEEAQKQRDWEQQMSNTQYQRTVADMKAAGINPYSLASGAQLTAMGSSAAATSGTGQNVLGSALNAILGFVKATKARSNVTVNKFYK